jgi:hypothetical protein
VGEERAETYLRRLAEAELRRVGGQLRSLETAAGTDAGSDPARALSAADSPLPGQLAALCQRLGAIGHHVTVPH